jgi:hypothetical protein
VNEEALAHWGLLQGREKRNLFRLLSLVQLKAYAGHAIAEVLSYRPLYQLECILLHFIFIISFTVTELKKYDVADLHMF